MTITLDQLIIVDLEATCWLGPPPPGQLNEIIEVGICLLDLDSAAISATRALIVCPRQSEVSPFCTELTSITPELIAAEGISFADACTIISDDYAAKTRVWSSWGSYDRKLFLSQCAAFEVAYPFSDRHINLKSVFRKRVSHHGGLLPSLTHLQIEPTGRLHRGVDDAYNTARIAAHLLQTYGRAALIGE